MTRQCTAASTRRRRITAESRICRWTGAAEDPWCEEASEASVLETLSRHLLSPL